MTDIGAAIARAQDWVEDAKGTGRIGSILASRRTEAKRNLAALGEPSVPLALAAKALLDAIDAQNAEAFEDEPDAIVVTRRRILAQKALGAKLLLWAQRVQETGERGSMDTS